MADDAIETTTSGLPELNPDSFGQYLEEIGRVELLTADQEVDLSRRIAAGRAAEELLAQDVGDPQRRAALRRLVRDGNRAHDRMVETNLRLVVSVAKRYRTRGITLADLVQEGNLGLLRAVDKFDPAKGYRFSTYATWWIRQTIGRGPDLAGAHDPHPVAPGRAAGQGPAGRALAAAGTGTGPHRRGGRARPSAWRSAS